MRSVSARHTDSSMVLSRGGIRDEVGLREPKDEIRPWLGQVTYRMENDFDILPAMNDQDSNCYSEATC
jgi:hypothetical protein